MRIDPEGVPSLQTYADAKAWYDNTRPWPKQQEYGDGRPLSRTKRAKKHLSLRYDRRNQAYCVRLYQTDIVTFFGDGTIEAGVYSYSTQSTRAVLHAINATPRTSWSHVADNSVVIDNRTGQIARARVIRQMPDKRICFETSPWTPPQTVSIGKGHPLSKHIRDVAARMAAIKKLADPRGLNDYLCGFAQSDHALVQLLLQLDRRALPIAYYAGFIAMCLLNECGDLTPVNELPVWVTPQRARYWQERCQVQHTIACTVMNSDAFRARHNMVRGPSPFWEINHIPATLDP